MEIFYLHLIFTNVLMSFLVSFIFYKKIFKFNFLIIFLVSFIGGVLFLFFIPIFYSDFYNRQLNIFLYLLPLVGSFCLVFLFKILERNKNDL